MRNPIQGQGLATPVKQDGLFGIIDTIHTMRKNHFMPIVFIDFYCGSGENVVNGMTINGSPISMLEAIAKSISRMADLPKTERIIVFNDIVSERVFDSLPNAVIEWQKQMGLPESKDMLTCYNKKNKMFTARIYYRAGTAQSLCGDVLALTKEGYHVVASIDPNGPKDIPWDEIRSIYDSRRGNQMELSINISSTVLKRVAKARQATNKNFAPMPDHVESMLRAFRGCSGWIREPHGKDQWTMLLLSRHPPKHGWSPKNGPKFLLINEPEGKCLIEHLSTTKKERAQNEY